jgi:hypothetical protein
MKSSIVILLVVIAVSMGCASNASAQCASLYTSDGPDGSGNVHAWTILTDNFTNSSSGCAPQNWPPNGFTHTYNLSISVTSPSGRKATGTGYGNQQGGQGTATTRADVYLAIDGEGGSFNLSGQDTIYCTVAGLFFFAGISGSFSPPPPVINGVSDNSTGSTTIYQGTSGYLAIYGTALTAWGETPSPTVTGDSGVTLSTYWASDTQVDASYTVSAQAATGQHSLALQTAAGRAQGTYTVAAPPRLSCVPSSITRGSSVTCTVTNATVTQWSFSASGVAVTGPANGSTWSGPVVISGTVTAAISSGGPLTAAITVNARPNFPAVTMPAPQLVGNGAYPPTGPNCQL